MSLHTKYRPRKLMDVVGHSVQLKALQRIIDKRSSRAFVFVGPSGVGKTTLARIVATEYGCDPQNILEIDAATNSGADAMRAVAEAIAYKPFGKGDGKAVIVDECHGLSRQAWDSLLKVVEEPPKHAVWFFCTTNAAKVPTTLKTRCHWVTLKAVPDNQIGDLLDMVIDEEKIVLAKDVLDLCIGEAHGSPRQALVNLAACVGVKSRREAAELLQVVLESDASIELCRFLMRPGSWAKAQAIVAKLAKEQPEGIRIMVCNYMGSVLKNARSDRDALNALNILEQFSIPYHQAEGLAPLFLSVGRVIFAGK